ncbi:MAG: hypothetical protein ACYS4W_14320 [Planctomycetota bacterium]
MPDSLQTFPAGRPQGYDPDLVYDEDTDTWGTVRATIHRLSASARTCCTMER